MGFFSKTCAKTCLPVMAGTSWIGDPRYSEVVCLFPNGDKLSGTYDGYGRIDGTDIVNRFDDAKFVLKMFYQDEAYAQLGKSHDEPGQGHFHDPRFVEQAFAKGGYASFDEYKRDLEAWPSREEQVLRLAHITCQVKGQRRTTIITVAEKPGIIYSGGNWIPGWECVDPDKLHVMEKKHDMNYDFLSECIVYAMNEGDVLEGTIDLDDDGKNVLVWKAEIQEGDDNVDS